MFCVYFKRLACGKVFFLFFFFKKKYILKIIFLFDHSISIINFKNYFDFLNNSFPIVWIISCFDLTQPFYKNCFQPNFFSKMLSYFNRQKEKSFLYIKNVDVHVILHKGTFICHFYIEKKPRLKKKFLKKNWNYLNKF